MRNIPRRIILRPQCLVKAPVGHLIRIIALSTATRALAGFPSVSPQCLRGFFTTLHIPLAISMARAPQFNYNPFMNRSSATPIDDKMAKPILAFSRTNSFY